MTLRTPYLLFIGDAPRLQLRREDRADGVAFWRREACLGQLRLPGCKADLRLPDMTVEEAAAAGVKTMIVGTTNRGGVLGEGWEGLLVKALELGMDLAGGLHHRLADIPVLRDTAARCGRQIADVRHPTREFPVGNGIKRPGKRLLTVGTDCSIGKMFTALALEKEMRGRGMKADFRATGQTGILIAGDGVSIDAVVSDFVSGAVEWLCPENDPDHWDVIEGQGSLFHASYAGVTLGLIHGAQPDALVVCHEPTRPHMRGLPGYKLPDLKLCIERNIAGGATDQPGSALRGVGASTPAALDPGRGARLSAPDRGPADIALRRPGAHRGRRHRRRSRLDLWRRTHSVSASAAAPGRSRSLLPYRAVARPPPRWWLPKSTTAIPAPAASACRIPATGRASTALLAALEAMRGAVASGLDREALQRAMPPGAARNALDAAFWDLAAKQTGRRAAELAGLDPPRPLVTAYTLSLDTPERMGEAAAAQHTRPLLKLKLTGDGDIERVAAVRRNAPQARLIVDANEGWTPRHFAELALKLAGVRGRTDRAAAARGCRRGVGRSAASDPGLRRRSLPYRGRSRSAGRQIVEYYHHQARQDGWAHRGAEARRGGARARLRHHGRLHDRHLAGDGAGHAGGAAGQRRRSRRTVAAGGRPQSGSALRR